MRKNQCRSHHHEKPSRQLLQPTRTKPSPQTEPEPPTQPTRPRHTAAPSTPGKRMKKNLREQSRTKTRTGRTCQNKPPSLAATTKDSTHHHHQTPTHTRVKHNTNHTTPPPQGKTARNELSGPGVERVDQHRRKARSCSLCPSLTSQPSTAGKLPGTASGAPWTWPARPSDWASHASG